MSETQSTLPNLAQPLRKQKALKAAWRPVLLQWLLPGLGYWHLGEKTRAKAFLAMAAIFLTLGALQMHYGPVDGSHAGVFVPVPGQWLKTLGALATMGMGPLYAPFAWAFGGLGSPEVAEPIQNLTQEYGATYVMLVGLLNWLGCIDVFDRATGRWLWRVWQHHPDEVPAGETLDPKG